MDELQAELVQREARRERFRYRLAAGVVFGMPLLAAAITVSVATTVQARFLSHHALFVVVAIGNAVVAAVGSAVGVWIEPGDRPNARIGGLLGGGVFGLLVYFALCAVALCIIDLVSR